MRTALYNLADHGWILHPAGKAITETAVQLVLCFSSKTHLQSPGIYDTVRSKFPAAHIIMCSTAGEICQHEVYDHRFTAVAIQFNNTAIETASVNIKDFSNTYSAAISLAKKMPAAHLRHVLVFSDGNLVNGSELVKGLAAHTDKKVLITGGLAGDDANFTSTLVGLNKQPAEGEITAIGFYGNAIQVSHGSQGGWDMFGLEKRVTNASANVLVEIEGQNALELYKKYLGNEAENLPAAALLFPLSVTIPGATRPVVRTILSINEEEKSMTFAGDVPVGSTVRFMKANFEKLTMASADAAAQTVAGSPGPPAFSLLISCVGRKLVLGEKTVDEVKAASGLFNGETVMAGFYSYGEIAPFSGGGHCQLHNQTMTITSFYEY